MTSIGSLRHRVTIQSAVRTRGTAGEMIPTWSDFAEVSAEVVPLSSYEKNLASQMQLEASHKMTIRYRPGITRDMRVLFRGRSHAIVGIKNPEELNQWLELQTHDRGAA